jgi:hypothetical protein
MYPRHKDLSVLPAGLGLQYIVVDSSQQQVQCKLDNTHILRMASDGLEVQWTQTGQDF